MSEDEIYVWCDPTGSHQCDVARCSLVATYGLAWSRPNIYVHAGPSNSFTHAENRCTKHAKNFVEHKGHAFPTLAPWEGATL